jgi:chromosome segregation ATPase
MHVLTKIFIVLVSLLAVLLVPLVVVYAHNEDSYRAKFEAAQAMSAAANQNLESARIAAAQREADLQLQIQELGASNQAAMREREAGSVEVRRLQVALGELNNQQAGVTSNLATISSAIKTAQDLIDSLLTEVRTMRADAADAERRVVQLDEAFRDKSSQLDVAVAARRALQEELQQLKEDHAHALEQVAAYRSKYGEIDLKQAPTAVANVDLDATVINVRRTNEQTLAEINAGSRDGLRQGWVLMIGRAGNFLGNLRIIAVDVNRATGVVEKEDPNRGKVEPGDRVYARRGS